jgi:hypothetical protein
MKLELAPLPLDANSIRNPQATTPGQWRPHIMKLELAPLPLELYIPSAYRLSKTSTAGGWQARPALDSTAKAARETHNLSWMPEQGRTAPSSRKWQVLHPESPLRCERSPSFPRIVWSIKEAGEATAQEDPKACSAFEHGLKARPAVFGWRSSTLSRQHTGHRARNRLPLARGNCSWRLVTDHRSTAKVA